MLALLKRGFLTGLAGSLGCAAFAILALKATLDAAAWGLVFMAGLLGGGLLGLALCLLLVVLRLVDGATGWQLARLLEHAEPGPAGLLLAFLVSIPSTLAGAVGAGFWTLSSLFQGALGFPADQAWFYAIFLVPLAAVAGGMAGAILGGMLVSLLAGAARALVGRNRGE